MKSQRNYHNPRRTFLSLHLLTAFPFPQFLPRDSTSVPSDPHVHHFAHVEGNPCRPKESKAIAETSTRHGYRHRARIPKRVPERARDTGEGGGRVSDANCAQSEVRRRLSTVAGNFRKHREIRRITLFVLQRKRFASPRLAGSANIPAAILPGPYFRSFSVFVSLSLSPFSLSCLLRSIRLSLILLGPTCGWIPACPCSQGPAQEKL